MSVLLETNFPELKLVHKGKVREIYDLGENYLFVATDRISAFDVVFNEGIPYKGMVLTQLSVFWFDRLKSVCENHLISADVKDFPEVCKKYSDKLNGRSLLVKKINIFPFECIARGYISGSAWGEYQKTKRICGINLPNGLKESDKLSEIIFTPTTKEAVGKHDENITLEEMGKRISEETAQKLKNLTIDLYKKASEIAVENGIIIADTKFEFGTIDGKIILADEVLTPDSSRFWSKKKYTPGQSQESFDKQIVRDYLLRINFNKMPPPPKLPDDIINRTSEKYLEILELLRK